jgi:hypothetical protein
MLKAIKKAPATYCRGFFVKKVKNELAGVTYFPGQDPHYFRPGPGDNSS